MTKVEIDTPGATVRIEADEPLEQVAAKAEEMFHKAGGWPQQKGAPLGFTGDRRWTADVYPTTRGRYGQDPLAPVTAKEDK